MAIGNSTKWEAYFYGRMEIFWSRKSLHFIPGLYPPFTKIPGLWTLCIFRFPHAEARYKEWCFSTYVSYFHLDHKKHWPHLVLSPILSPIRICWLVCATSWTFDCCWINSNPMNCAKNRQLPFQGHGNTLRVHCFRTIHSCNQHELQYFSLSLWRSLECHCPSRLRYQAYLWKRVARLLPN